MAGDILINENIHQMIRKVVPNGRENRADEWKYELKLVRQTDGTWLMYHE